jgi:predicted ester cyclase
MFVEYNGVSLIGGNCKKSLMNIMLIPPNGKRLDFNFYSFKCIVASRVQHAIDISSIMMNWILGHMSILCWVWL